MTLRLTFFFAALTTLAIVHIGAIRFFFYWKYIWFDIPVHFLGGVTVALGISILPLFRVNIFERATFLPYVLVAFTVGILWEVFEITSGFTTVTESGFALDTALDLAMDVSGGVLGYALARTLKKI